jgi:sugar (glycoside-pentoside-hexuronide) transporter
MADASPRRLTVATKVIYAMGDHTINVFLTAMTILYIRFLTDVLHFPAALAGAIPLAGRAVDAITDPLMGRISDHTRWRWGRRRPYLLIGCVPFAASFVLLWVNPPFAGQTADFVYYSLVYVLLSVFSTVVSVPYIAMIPEMARNYDERTSLNTYRSAAGLMGVFVTLGMSALARSMGDDGQAWFQAAMIIGVWLVLPWFAVYRVTWERPQSAPQTLPIGESLRLVARHRTYMHLCAIYIPGRIAIDLVSALFFYYIAWVIGRREDFEITLAAFLIVVILALPFWLYLSKRFDKRSVMLIGLLWWMFAQLILFFGDADWPRWGVFLVAGFAGIGYSVADIMPWAMLPDVIDEDELKTGERREGLYSGMFTFLRKIGGAVAIFMMGIALSAAGYDGSAPKQSESAVTAIRILMAVVPIFFLGLTVWIARTYPLSREVHHAILTELARREKGAGI